MISSHLLFIRFYPVNIIKKSYSMYLHRLLQMKSSVASIFSSWLKEIVFLLFLLPPFQESQLVDDTALYTSVSICASQKRKSGRNTYPFLVNLSLLTIGLFFLVTQGRNPPTTQRPMYHTECKLLLFSPYCLCLVVLHGWLSYLSSFPFPP